MASETKPTLFIIPGAWHVPEHYKKFRGILESQGYEVHIPRLPSANGTRPPSADLNADSLLVRHYVESLVQAGRTVVVIMHSFGGQVGSNGLYGLGLEARAKQGQPGGISHLIYVSAYILPEGKAATDKNVEFGHMDLLPLAVDFADDYTCVPRVPKAVMVGPWSDEAELDEYTDTLVRWNGKLLYQPCEHAAWRDIPMSYISTTLDLCLPASYQTSMVDWLKKEGYEFQTFELEAHHCPHVTVVDDLVQIVNKIIRG